jgi:hypothetical protein
MVFFLDVRRFFASLLILSLLLTSLSSGCAMEGQERETAGALQVCPDDSGQFKELAGGGVEKIYKYNAGLKVSNGDEEDIKGLSGKSWDLKSCLNTSIKPLKKIWSSKTKSINLSPIPGPVVERRGEFGSFLKVVTGVSFLYLFKALLFESEVMSQNGEGLWQIQEKEIVPYRLSEGEFGGVLIALIAVSLSLVSLFCCFEPTKLRKRL